MSENEHRTRFAALVRLDVRAVASDKPSMIGLARAATGNSQFPWIFDRGFLDYIVLDATASLKRCRGLFRLGADS